MRLIASVLMLGSCGPATEPASDDAAANGIGPKVAPAQYRLAPEEERYRACVRSALTEHGSAASESADQIRRALGSCRPELREAAVAELRRAPPFRNVAPPEDQILVVMARKEGDLARRLHPAFPVL